MSENLFWADEAAAKVVEGRDRFTVATGITPSGEIHIGNLREVVTADAVVRALRSKGKPVEFIYIGDTYDPLRRVYPFLDAGVYGAHVGKPLSEIPGPKGDGKSYAEHFLAPFLESLREMEVDVRVERADRMYKEGRYNANILKALAAKDKIREILKKETGKETGDDWSPFNPICQACGRITETKVHSFDAQKEEIEYSCACGDRRQIPIAGGGKLTWRVDWPARWQILGVTVEPFGKDHASRGGSYDTGIRIAREIFGYEPPFPVVYEWISLRGAGDMSSSKGNVLSVHEMIDVVPAEVLKYFVIKVKPNKSIVFDPGVPMVTLLDEFDDPTSAGRNARAAELAKVSSSAAVGVPFRHVVTLMQTTRGDLAEMGKVLQRSGYEGVDAKALEKRVEFARKWLDRFGPEDMKVEVQDALPDAARSLNEAQKKALAHIAERLADGMTAQQIHELVYEAKDRCGLPPQELFIAIYRSILGKDKGPRAGFFLASLDAPFVRSRFAEAAAPRT